jgi:hypothetical protein
MWTEAELPDLDYESVYGHDAMLARLLARCQDLLRAYAQCAAAPLRLAVPEAAAPDQGQA